MILQNLKSFITKKTVIFVFFMLAQIVTLIGVLVTFNYLEQEISTQKSYYDDMRTYTVMLSDSSDTDKKLSDILNKCDYIQHIYTVSFLTPTTAEDEINNEYRIYGEYYGKSGLKFNVALGSYLSETDISDGNKNIVIPASFMTDFNIGDTYSLNGSNYKIIGSSTDGNFHIPFNSTDDKYQISGVCVTTDRELNSSEANQFKNTLSDIFSEADVISPSGEYGSEFNSFKTVMFIIILLMCLGIFNLSYLYTFILEQRKKQYAVFQICGCTKLKGAFIYLGEILIISTAAYTVSAVLFKFAVLPLVILADSMTVYAMSVYSYVFLFTAYILIMLFVFLPCIIRYTSKSAALQYKN